MDCTSTQRIMKILNLVGLTLALLVGATAADAQDREGKWEFTLGAAYQLGADLEGEAGSTLETDDDFGFAMMGGYNFSDSFATTFGFQWADIGYDGTVLQQDGSSLGISGSYEAWTMSGNAIWHLMDGPLTPYVGAGLGWTWIDTNVPTGPPVTGCWWDPWWGYVCYTDYPTKTTDAFSYQAILGVRYEFNPSTFMRLGYTSQWADFENADSTPRFDVVMLEIGWMF